VIAEHEDKDAGNTSSLTPFTISTEVSIDAENPKPRCPGTCHGTVMSLFCEHVDTTFGCPEGEFCCIRKPTTSTPVSIDPEIPDCRGFCIPYFLSGLCYRPAKLILRTINCEQETICCDNTVTTLTPAIPDDSENEMRKSRLW
ncbi:hypothetical protein BIW11_11976, partial [Tropilaelaps mercedesae]